MPRRSLLPFPLVLMACSASAPQTPSAASSASPLQYPAVPRVDHTETLHGVVVADPYRWLEDANSEQTRAFVEAQNALTFGFLEAIPSRRAITQRLTQLWNFERFGTPHREASRYFFMRNSGLQNQSVLYWADSLTAEPKLLLDPNTLADDGTTALADWVVSPNGKYVAYALAGAGSDWKTWRVREVETGRDLSDVVRWTKFSTVSWTHDSQGFYYSRYDEPKAGSELDGTNYYNKLFFHRLGDEQSKDVLVYERPDHKEWGFDGEVSRDGKYLIITTWKGTDDNYLVSYQEIGKPEIIPLVSEWKADYRFRGNDGETFYFRTNDGAPKGKLVAVDLSRPTEFRDIIPEAEETLEAVLRVGDTFVASYLQDAHAKLVVYDTRGKLLREVALPGLGSVSGLSGDATSPEAFFAFESFTQPATIYRYDVNSGEQEVFKQPQLAFDPSAYETRQVFYTSKDGTRVPLFIVGKKGLTQDGQNPTLLYGYGGFNIPLTPGFSVGNLVWMEMGGLYAVANLRGGGEYGRAWHEAGKRHNKQNVFDDFIAAAEYLIAEKYTSQAKLAIHGRSNGGLLVGAAMTQRPDLFAAALPGVGVLDMLRFHKFTIGWAWTDDYGSPDVAEDFQTLLAYSPLHNLAPNTAYPATLITTADHDDRVVPAHSYKFAAALQAAHTGAAPVLIRIDTKAGHGAGKPTQKRIEELADQWAFLTKVLEMSTNEALAEK